MKLTKHIIVIFLALGIAVADGQEQSSGDQGRWEEFCREKKLDSQGCQKVARSAEQLFPIGIWFDGRVEGINVPAGCVNVPAGEALARDYYRRMFRDIKRHNIDLIVIPNTPPEYRPWLLQEAQRTGVKVVLEIVEFVDFIRNNKPAADDWETILELVQGVYDQIGTSESLLFYQLIDEPVPQRMERIKKLSRVLAAVDTRRASFSCLALIHDKQELIRQWDPAMVIYDHYPLIKGGEFGSLGLLHNEIDTAYRFAEERPLWMVVQTFAHAVRGCRVPTVEEVRAMTYLSLAHGAKGIFFFLYNSNTQTEHLIGLDQLSCQFVEVFDLATRLKKLAPILLKLKKIGPISASPSQLDAQMFKNQETGQLHLFLVNKNIEESYDDVLQLTETQGHNLYDCLTDTPLKTGPEGFALKLRTGEGILIRIQ